jgi:polyisoprenoid-binding protein YceI
LNFSINVTPAFKFSGQDQYTITGLSTIKGITKTVSFPATITKEMGMITAEAKISINRTKWNVMHQAESFLSTLKDGVITNEVIVTLKLKFGGC